jgi:phage-related protein
MSAIKHLIFRGSSLDDLRNFPAKARSEAGYQLDRIQHGHDADDWKPMATVGPGVKEIRVKDEAGIFRVMHVAKIWLNLPMLSTFYIASRRSRSKPITSISTWPRHVTKNY